MSNEPKSKTGALALIQDRLLDPNLPPEVRENTQRYCEHVARLDQHLRNVGMEHGQIDQHLLEIFEDYERELSASVKRVEMDMNDD